jgi:hypothetical protein
MYLSALSLQVNNGSKLYTASQNQTEISKHWRYAESWILIILHSGFKGFSRFPGIQIIRIIIQMQICAVASILVVTGQA